jgi:hypothetical protein
MQFFIRAATGLTCDSYLHTKMCTEVPSGIWTHDPSILIKRIKEQNKRSEQVAARPSGHDRLFKFVQALSTLIRLGDYKHRPVVSLNCS